MKKVLLVFILIFSFSFLCGCDNKPTTQIGDDFILLSIDSSLVGTSTQSIRFSVNSKQINNLSSSLQEELDFRKNLVSGVGKLRNEFLLTFALIYLRNPIDQYKIGQGIILTDVLYSEESDCVGFDIVFTSYGSWLYYHMLNEGTSSSGGDNGNLFFNKTTTKGVFPFSSKVDEKLIGENYKQIYLDSAKGLSFEEKIKNVYSPQFVYNYSTTSSKIKSDSNSTFLGVDKKYHHVWVVSENELSENNSITLSTIRVNKGWWMFFAIFIPLLIMTCLLLCKNNTLKKKVKKFNLNKKNPN